MTGRSGMIVASVRRVLVVAALTFHEARRRRILFIFLSGCILFLGTGSACTYACGRLDQSGEQQYRGAVEREMVQRGMSAEERQAQLAELDRRLVEERVKKTEGLSSALYVMSYLLLAFWLYLLTLFLTPFLALNDFNQNTHVLVLARPVRRWEYLLGKVGGTAGLLVASLLLLLVCSLGFLRLAAGVWGWELFRGLPYLLTGLGAWICMVFFLALTIGRLPAVFLALVVLLVTAAPNYLIAAAQQPEGWSGKLLVYGLGYALPQFSVSVLHGLGAVSRDLSGAGEILRRSDLYQIGNNSGPISLALNVFWILFYGVAAALVFRRRDLNT